MTPPGPRISVEPQAFGDRRIRAVIFDVDGTLYVQRPLQRAMLGRLVRLLAEEPRRGWQTIRILRAYRGAQESLRGTPAAGDVAAAQIRLAAARSGVDEQTVASCVGRWMDQEPLDLLAGCVPPGTLALLHECRARGVRLAALSDYPADDKLRVMGMRGLFDLVVCAQSPDVNAFKPNPRGLLVAMQRLGAAAAECLYVGDRVDVDGAAAAAAGVRCAIISHGRRRRARHGHAAVAGLDEVLELLDMPARSSPA
jgi:FMN phosphatase YigB (HAD superfamily)